MKRSIIGPAAWKLLLAGLLAGFLNGLLGSGGGIIIVFALSKVLSDTVTGKNGAFATALCVMLPISVLSCAIYAFRGHMSLDGFGIFIIPAVVGGALGGLLLGKLRSDLLKTLFSALIAVSGIILIMR